MTMITDTHYGTECEHSKQTTTLVPDSGIVMFNCADCGKYLGFVE